MRRRPDPRHLRAGALAAGLLLALQIGSPLQAQTNPPSDSNTAARSSAAAAIPLADLLARALPHDPQVRVADALRQAAEDRLRQIRSRFAPVLGVATTYGRSQDAELFRSIDRTTDRAEATLRWNLYNGGADRVELDAAERELEASGEDLRRAREEVSERVTEVALDLARLDAQLERGEQRIAVIRRLAQQVSLQAELGRLSDADLRQATASLVDAELALDQLVGDRAGALARLAVLVNELPPPLQPLFLPTAGDGEPASLRASRLRAEAARLRVRPLQSVLAPRVDMDLRKRLSERTQPSATSELQRGWTLNMRFEFPLGGETVYRRDEVEHRAEAAEAEVMRQSQLLQAERAALAPRLQGAERGIVLVGRQVEQLDALVRSGEAQFEAGRRTLQQLIQAHEARLAALQRLEDQRFRLASARLRELALAGRLLLALGLAAEPNRP